MQDLELSSWESFKEVCITRKNLNCQYGETDSQYTVVGPDATISWIYFIKKSSPRGEEQADFEDNYKGDFNWAVGGRPYAFATGDFVAEFDGVSGDAVAGDVTPFDYQILTPKCYMNGAFGFGSNIAVGDWVDFCVRDNSGLIPEPARAVFPLWPILSQWVKKLYVHSTVPVDIQTPYAGHPPQGMWLRMNYHSVGSVNPKFFINYYLHEGI